jgi:hypothetical protein
MKPGYLNSQLSLAAQYDAQAGQSSGSQETTRLNRVSMEFSSSSQETCQQASQLIGELEANPSDEAFSQIATQNSTDNSVDSLLASCTNITDGFSPSSALIAPTTGTENGAGVAAGRRQLRGLTGL